MSINNFIKSNPLSFKKIGESQPAKKLKGQSLKGIRKKWAKAAAKTDKKGNPNGPSKAPTVGGKAESTQFVHAGFRNHTTIDHSVIQFKKLHESSNVTSKVTSNQINNADPTKSTNRKNKTISTTYQLNGSHVNASKVLRQAKTLPPGESIQLLQKTLSELKKSPQKDMQIKILTKALIQECKTEINTQTRNLKMQSFDTLCERRVGTRVTETITQDDGTEEYQEKTIPGQGIIIESNGTVSLTDEPMVQSTNELEKGLKAMLKFAKEVLSDPSSTPKDNESIANGLATIKGASKRGGDPEEILKLKNKYGPEIEQIQNSVVSATTVSQLSNIASTVRHSFEQMDDILAKNSFASQLKPEGYDELLEKNISNRENDLVNNRSEMMKSPDNIQPVKTRMIRSYAFIDSAGPIKSFRALEKKLNDSGRNEEADTLKGFRKKLEKSIDIDTNLSLDFSEREELFSEAMSGFENILVANKDLF